MSFFDVKKCNSCETNCFCFPNVPQDALLLMGVEFMTITSQKTPLQVIP